MNRKGLSAFFITSMSVNLVWGLEINKNIMDKIVTENRKVLFKVPNWIDKKTYAKSIFSYGIPQTIIHLIDKPIGNEITYSDILCYLSTFLKKPVCYLELGVSVGKNFFQVERWLNNATLIGFEIEEIAPTLKTLLGNNFEIVDCWKTMPSSLKRTESSLGKFDASFNKNNIFYLSGDVFDIASWQRLKNQKFNIIFSDAFHTPEALLFELKILSEYNLLGEEELVIVWDDLGGAMSDAFFSIVRELKKSYKHATAEIIQANGWIGINEYRHQIGIFSALNLVNSN